MVGIFITPIFLEKMLTLYCGPLSTLWQFQKSNVLCCAIVFKDGHHEAIPSLYVHDNRPPSPMETRCLFFQPLQSGLACDCGEP